ncbi:MAG: Flp family type IVb pilin [Bdellovibrionia bacterium]
MEQTTSPSVKHQILDLLRILIRSEDGQATTEYILILALSVFGVTQLAKGILSALDSVIGVLGGHLERDLKSGRLGPGAWQN